MPKRKLQGDHSEPKPLRQRTEYTRKANNCARCHSVWTTPIENGEPDICPFCKEKYIKRG